MHAPAHCTRVILFCAALLASSSAASAQNRSYVGGAAIADIRRFDSVRLDPRILADLGDISSRDGTAAGGGLRVGTFLHRLWSLELAVDASSRSTNAFRNPYELLGSRSSMLRLPELSSSTSFLTVSTVVGFHPARTGRVRMGYLGGLALVRGTYESTFPEFSYIPIELSFISDLSVLTGISSRALPVPDITGRTLGRTDNSTGGVLGVEAAIDLTDHLAIVPGLRTIVFSNQGQSVFLIRPEVGARWNF